MDGNVAQVLGTIAKTLSEIAATLSGMKAEIAAMRREKLAESRHVPQRGPAVLSESASPEAHHACGLDKNTPLGNVRDIMEGKYLGESSKEHTAEAPSR